MSSGLLCKTSWHVPAFQAQRTACTPSFYEDIQGYAYNMEAGPPG